MNEKAESEGATSEKGKERGISKAEKKRGRNRRIKAIKINEYKRKVR